MALKEVYFSQYCPICKHKNKDEIDEPCCDCLDEPSNEDSHRPVYFENQEAK